jgi:hypothetical protein
MDALDQTVSGLPGLWLGHHGAFRAVSAVTPRFVHKSVHNTHADVGSIGWQ